VAKKHQNHHFRVSFHRIIKLTPNEADSENPIESGFTQAEFERVLDRISDNRVLNEQDEVVIRAIKSGKELPFSNFETVEDGLYFGAFEGAYYGQRYRNNKVGLIDPDSLNLRRFYYLITRRRDGTILVGTTYHGQFGDYDGLKSCVSFLIRGNYDVGSRTLKSVSAEIGAGTPVEIKLTYRRTEDRPERQPLFGTSGVFAVKNSEYGEGFAERITEVSRSLRGNLNERRRILAGIINQGSLLEVRDEDIVGCSAIIRENGSQRTVYFLGENNFSTKFPLMVAVDANGDPEPVQLKSEMVRIMRETIIPMLR
jgi:hypothetical protein